MVLMLRDRAGCILSIGRAGLLRQKGVAVALVLLAALFSASCRNFGDFWNRKRTTSDTGGLLPNQVAPPGFAPAAGSYNATQNVVLASATPGATICYTTDGVTNPVCDAANSTCTTGTAYSAAIAVSADTTIRAVACKADMIDSPLAFAAYTIDTTAPVISAVSPAPASYAVNAQVSYTFSEACASASIT
jgi:hypothetical protein